MSKSRSRASVVHRIGWVAVASLMALALLPGSMIAAPKEYEITVDKSANPTSLPAKGGDVTYTVAVTNIGTGFLQVIVIEDSDCNTWDGPTGDVGQKGKLETDETWSYTCTTAVTPPDTNTVTVNACHDGSVENCNNANHAAQATDSVTVTVTATPTPTPTPAPGTTLPPTDSVAGSGPGADSLGLVLMLVAGLLASVMVLTPALGRRR